MILTLMSSGFDAAAAAAAGRLFALRLFLPPMDRMFRHAARGRQQTSERPNGMAIFFRFSLKGEVFFCCHFLLVARFFVFSSQNKGRSDSI